MARLRATINDPRGTGRLDGPEFVGVHARPIRENTPKAILVRAIRTVTGLGQADVRLSSLRYLVKP